ncbi:MAG TPA: hypothetical protein VL068_02160 [Microthrixaceae bacterium]|nr:hypothetical protein [Microthrixaceae bacterium]
MVKQHKRVSPRRPATRRATWSGRAALVVGVVCLALGSITPSAGADNARIAAEARCDRVVSWVVQAVAGSDNGSSSTTEARSNDSVEVSYRPARSGEGDWVPVETSKLGVSNDFSFSGSFPLPEAVDSVELRVLPKAKWGDGAKAGSPKFAVATVPEECDSMPAVAVISPNCAAGGAVVDVKNVGQSPMNLDLTVDRVGVRTFELAAGAGSRVAVPILAGESSVIRVNAGDFVVAQRKVAADCSSSGSSASVLEQCSSRQAVVSASLNSKTAPSDGSDEIEIRAAGTIVHKAKLSPGKVFQRTLELPADGSVPIEVKLGKRTASIGEFGLCDGPVAGSISCGGPTQVACAVEPPVAELEPPPPPPPPLILDLESGTLPVTGPWQRAIVLLISGALLSAGGFALLADQRRRPKPSLLASSVGNYRRQWWD